MPSPGLVAPKPERAESRTSYGNLEDSVFGEAINGTCDLRFKILTLSGNSNHLRKYYVHMFRDSFCNQV